VRDKIHLGKTSFPGSDSFGDSMFVAKRSFLTRTPTCIPQALALYKLSMVSDFHQ